MKILFFNENLGFGGKERRLLELLSYLGAHTPYEVHLVVMDNSVDYEYIHTLNIKFTILARSSKIKKDPSIFFKFAKVLKKINPDIIHTWGPTPTFYAIPSNLFKKRPLIGNIIANAKKGFGKYSFTNFLFNTAFKFADIVLANSIAGLKEYGMFNNPKSRLIYNGVRLERFNISVDVDNFKQELGLGNSKVILMVARASRGKDYDLFIDTAKLFQDYHESVKFIAVGNGPDLGLLQKRVTDESVDNVIFLGGRRDVEKLVHIADICVLFTNNKFHGEGISNAIIEYMASYKPVITTDQVGGSNEIIKDSFNGFILPPDPKQIYTQIDSLLKAPNEMAILGENARKTIEDKFSVEIMAKEYIRMYDEIMGTSTLVKNE